CIVYANTPDGVVGVFSKPQMNADMNFSIAPLAFSNSVASAPAVNSANAGSAVPLLFTASSFEGMNVLNIVSVSSEPIDCQSGQSTGTAGAASGAGGSGVQYDAGVYQFNWKTDKAWAGTCRQFQIQVNGASLTANFHFR